MRLPSLSAVLTAACAWKAAAAQEENKEIKSISVSWTRQCILERAQSLTGVLDSCEHIRLCRCVMVSESIWSDGRDTNLSTKLTALPRLGYAKPMV